MSKEDRGFSGSAVTYGVILLLVVYFLVPVPLMYPLLRLGLRHPEARALLTTIFYPVGLLESHSPHYQRLLRYEAQLLGLMP